MGSLTTGPASHPGAASHESGDPVSCSCSSTPPAAPHTHQRPARTRWPCRRAARARSTACARGRSSATSPTSRASPITPETKAPTDGSPSDAVHHGRPGAADDPGRDESGQRQQHADPELRLVRHARRRRLPRRRAVRPRAADRAVRRTAAAVAVVTRVVPSRSGQGQVDADAGRDRQQDEVEQHEAGVAELALRAQQSRSPRPRVADDGEQRRSRAGPTGPSSQPSRATVANTHSRSGS